MKDVNVGSSNYNANWIDWGTATQDLLLTDNNSWDAQNGSCSKGNKSDRSSCLSQNGNPKWTPDNHNTWNGCVVDRGAASGPSILNTDTNVASAQHRADRHAVRGRTVQLVPAGHHAAQLRLDRR